MVMQLPTNFHTLPWLLLDPNLCLRDLQAATQLVQGIRSSQDGINLNLQCLDQIYVVNLQSIQKTENILSILSH